MKKAITCVLIALLPACADVLDDESIVDDSDVEESAVVIGTLSATPDPLTFPKALVGQTVFAELKVANAKTATKTHTITDVAIVTKGPFSVGKGGTCNTLKGAKALGPGKSCTLQFAFKPTKPNTVVKGSGTVTLVSGKISTTLTFGLSGAGLEFGLTAVPDPLVFPDATFGGTECGSPGGTACTYGMITIHNNLPTDQTIVTAFADAPFWVTWGGSCNSLALNKTIPAYGACELQWGFAPTAAGAKFSGTGTVSFNSGLNLTLGLQGASN